MFYQAIRSFLLLYSSLFGVREVNFSSNSWARNEVNLPFYYREEFRKVYYDENACQADIHPANITFPTT